MTDTTDTPPQGSMYLFDAITPPLPDGSYRLTAETDVSAAGAPPTFQDQRYFTIVGPRFTVPPGMVAGCFPPNNAHGAFYDALPHIVLSRRTLPWERKLYRDHPLPTPKTDPTGPQPLDLALTPWVALLLFEESEYTLHRGVPLEQAVPSEVFQRLGSPQGIICDAISASRDVVASIMPSLEELQLLAHGRWVNVDDRELNTAGGDGFYSVVVSNRLPEQGKQYRAALVSLEERFDLISADPPPTAGPRWPVRQGPVTDIPEAARAQARDMAATMVRPRVNLASEAAPEEVALPAYKPEATVASSAMMGGGTAQTPFPLASPIPHQIATQGVIHAGPIAALLEVSLVVLTSWKFSCDPDSGTFRWLTTNLDDKMFGSVLTPGQPALSDTGHLQLTLQDRMGASETVWYRGPLVPYALTRDPLGPYHSADQARRVTPDTGAEDVSYAAAFEVGRLLAAADARLAQELMRWRRESYKQSARTSVLQAINARLALSLPPLAEALHTPIVPVVAASTAGLVAQSGQPAADPYGMGKVAGAPGLNPDQVRQAWNLTSVQEARTLLQGDSGPGALGPVADPGGQTPRPDTTLTQVLADTASLERLSVARDQIITDAGVKLGGS